MYSMYSINIFKQYLNFSASHFVIFANGIREPLHGHNYSVALKLYSPSLKDDMVFNFLDIKPLLKRICDSLDHHLLLPTQNPFLEIIDDERDNRNFKINVKNIKTVKNIKNVKETKDINVLIDDTNCNCEDNDNNYDQFSIPKKDVLLLPLSNISVECLSQYLLHLVKEEIEINFSLTFDEMELEVEETPGQSATYKLSKEFY